MTETTANLLKRRTGLLGPNVSTFYDDPVHLVRGRRGMGVGCTGKKNISIATTMFPMSAIATQEWSTRFAVRHQSLNTHTTLSSRGHPQLC